MIFMNSDLSYQKCPQWSPEVPSVLSVHSSFISQAQLSLISSIALSYPKHSSFISEAQLLYILSAGYKRAVWDNKELCWDKTVGVHEDHFRPKSYLWWILHESDVRQY